MMNCTDLESGQVCDAAPRDSLQVCTLRTSQSPTLNTFARTAYIHLTKSSSFDPIKVHLFHVIPEARIPGILGCPPKSSAFACEFVMYVKAARSTHFQRFPGIPERIGAKNAANTSQVFVCRRSLTVYYSFNITASYFYFCLIHSRDAFQSQWPVPNSR